MRSGFIFDLASGFHRPLKKKSFEINTPEEDFLPERLEVGYQLAVGKFVEIGR